jgi:hypothetical protein
MQRELFQINRVRGHCMLHSSFLTGITDVDLERGAFISRETFYAPLATAYQLRVYTLGS